MLNIILIAVMIFFVICAILILFMPYSNDDLVLKQTLCPTYAVLTVKNKEDIIEGIIRSIAWQIQNAPENSTLFPKELVVLDLDSQDQTFQILTTLAKEYPFIHPMRKSEYIDFVLDI